MLAEENDDSKIHFIHLMIHFIHLMIHLKKQPYLWDWTGNLCGSGGGALCPGPTLGGRGGTFLNLLGEIAGVVGDVLPSPFLPRWIGNVWGRVWEPHTDGGWTCACVGILMEVWDTGCVSCLGERGAWASCDGPKEDVKRCGGQLGLLRGGTGGKVGSDGDTEGLGGVSSGALQRNLVLSFGTGLPLSASTPPSLSSSFPSVFNPCFSLRTDFFSSFPTSSFLLDTCLSRGTGFSLSFGVGLHVSPSSLWLSGRPLCSCWAGASLSVFNNLQLPVSDVRSPSAFSVSPSHCATTGSRLLYVLFRLARMRLWWPGRVMPICSSWPAARLWHSCTVFSPAVWNASEYCSRRSPHSQSPTVTQDSDWAMADAAEVRAVGPASEEDEKLQLTLTWSNRT